MASNQRNQTFPINFPAGTAGTQEIPVVLDRKYTKANGVAAYVNALGGAPFLRIGLRDETVTLLENTNSKFLEAGIDCPKSQRWTNIEAPADGTNLYIIINLGAPLTATLSLDMVFSLVKE